MTLTRRGSTVFLLNDDNEPTVVSQTLLEDGVSSALRYWLQVPVAILLARLPSSTTRDKNSRWWRPIEGLVSLCFSPGEKLG